MLLWRCIRLVAAASVQAYRLMHRLWKHVCTKTKSISACADQSRAPIKRLEPSEALGEPLLATSLHSGPSSAWDDTINTHRKGIAAVAEKRLKRGLRRIYCDLDYTSKTVSHTTLLKRITAPLASDQCMGCHYCSCFSFRSVRTLRTNVGVSQLSRASDGWGKPLCVVLRLSALV